MNSQKQTKRQRQYFIDWLRIGLIISVFLFHVGMIFRPENWHVNSNETFVFLDPIMWWLHLWRMPLLFLVSGIGTYYALGFRTTKQYLKERVKRLYIPFAVGFFTLVPLMVYVERIEMYSSLWDFIPHMFDGGAYPQGNISWHHLWFILYLFIISLLISPFIKYTRSNHFNKVRNKLVAIVSRKFALNWLLPILFISQLVLRQYFPNSTHALYNDWAYFTFYMLFFLIGFVLFTSDIVIKAAARQRRLYLIQTLVFSVLLFTVSSLFDNPEFRKYARGFVEIGLAWSCGITAIGYARIYFNQDHKLRKVLNEAIYPFYLLHQPALIFVGYFVLQWEVSYLLQAILITVISFISIVITYWFLIRKLNLLRISFGMKSKARIKSTELSNKAKLRVERILSK